MKRLFIVLVLVVAAGVGLGFYRGWFNIGSDNTGSKSNITLSMNRDKFQDDRKAVVEKVETVEQQAKDKFAGPSEKTMDGTVVSVSGGKLTMTSKGEKEHSHTLAANVKVTCDNKTCTTEDLKAGMRIRVTTGTADEHPATRIEALDKNADFEKAA